MFGNPAGITLFNARECPDLTAAVRAKMTGLRQMTSGERNTWDVKMTVFATSCEQDRWTEPFAGCLRASSVAREPLMPCLSVAPLPLRAKIEERLRAGMRRLGVP
jgi:hypothetical protein